MNKSSMNTPAFAPPPLEVPTLTLEARPSLMNFPVAVDQLMGDGDIFAAQTEPSRIAFGSCNDQDNVNNLWPIIESRNPAAFVWGGDAIYADNVGPIDWSTFPLLRSASQCATPGQLKSLYQRQRRHAGYRQLLENNVTIFGTFDDHDYGCNNADRDFEFKYESGLAFTEFLGIPATSAMRRRAVEGHGVYGVKLFDFSRPAGDQEVPEQEAGIDADLVDHDTTYASYSNQTVAVFVLDVRTSKTPWITGAGPFNPDYQGDFLGESQWKWFESSIQRSRAAVNVIVNGLQVHANLFPNADIAESWSSYPVAQQRLFDALLQDGVEAPVLISGDVHMTQLMRKDCVRKGDLHNRRSLVELTTSGMTHSWGSLSTPMVEQSNQPFWLYWKEWYESSVRANTMRLMHYVCPWTSIMISDTEGHGNLHESGGGENARTGRQFSLQKNFGELEFDWNDRTVALRSFGENPNDPPLLMARMSMDQLSGRAPMPSGGLTQQDFLAEADAGGHRSMDNSEWICVNHRGRDSPLAHVISHTMTAVVLIALVPLPFLLPILAFVSFRKRSQQPETFVNNPRPSTGRVEPLSILKRTSVVNTHGRRRKAADLSFR